VIDYDYCYRNNRNLFGSACQKFGSVSQEGSRRKDQEVSQTTSGFVDRFSGIGDYHHTSDLSAFPSCCTERRTGGIRQAFLYCVWVWLRMAFDSFRSRVLGGCFQRQRRCMMHATCTLNCSTKADFSLIRIFIYVIIRSIFTLNCTGQIGCYTFI